MGGGRGSAGRGLVLAQDPGDGVVGRLGRSRQAQACQKYRYGYDSKQFSASAG
jgi:hypothetical protein